MSDPAACCNIRKVEPLKRALSGVDAWITGVRRDQAPTRANARKVEWDEKFGLVKANPLADWTLDDVWTYIKENDVPYNELHDQELPVDRLHLLHDAGRSRRRPALRALGRQRQDRVRSAPGRSPDSKTD